MTARAHPPLPVRRLIWGARMSPKRTPSRVIKCPHCSQHYDVAFDFDAHDEGKCVRGAKGAS